VQRWIALFASLGLLVFWATQITGGESGADAEQTLQMAINLAHEGSISLDEEPEYRPTMYREPLPIFSAALVIKTVEWFLGRELSFEDYRAGDGARYIKYQNVLWLALLTIATFWACYTLTASFYVSLVAVLVLNVRYPATSSGLDGLQLDSVDPEVISVALLVLASVLLAMAASSGKAQTAVLAGLAFGALALSKAAMLYVFIGLLGVLLLLSALPRTHVPNRATVLQTLLLAVGFCSVVAPWMYRNHLHFGSFQIVERGGAVLYMRAVKNGMSAEEYRGSFYVWAPGRLQGLVGAALGFSERDLQEGGRLQRLNRADDSGFAERDLAAEYAGKPAEAVTYYRKARAERARVQDEVRARGIANPTVEADRILQDEALAVILAHPGDHLLMTIAFLWRGAAVVFPVLCAGLIYALLRRRTEIAIFILPSMGLTLFFALFSHFIPRYGVSAVPVAIVIGLFLATRVWQRLAGSLPRLSAARSL
jgi:hypothetical protein